jgi:hypothetical protein
MIRYAADQATNNGKSTTKQKKQRLRAPQSIYDQLALLEEKAKRLQLDDPVLFIGIPVDPEVLRLEHEFKLS